LLTEEEDLELEEDEEEDDEEELLTGWGCTFFCGAWWVCGRDCGCGIGCW
jgi:hypothetical protein